MTDGGDREVRYGVCPEGHGDEQGIIAADTSADAHPYPNCPVCGSGLDHHDGCLNDHPWCVGPVGPEIPGTSWGGKCATCFLRGRGHDVTATHDALSDSPLTIEVRHHTDLENDMEEPDPNETVEQYGEWLSNSMDREMEAGRKRYGDAWTEKDPAYMYRRIEEELLEFRQAVEHDHDERAAVVELSDLVNFARFYLALTFREVDDDG